MSSRATAIRRLAVAGLSSFLVLVAAFAAPGSTESTNTTPAMAHTSVSSGSIGNLQHAAAATTLGAATASTGLNAGLTVEPRVPRAAGTPCEVVLFTNLGFQELVGGEGASNFRYVPPSTCPRPWAKVILQLDLSGPRSYESAFLKIGLGNTLHPSLLLFQGAPQEHQGLPVWRVERDLTEYASHLVTARDGYTGTNWDNADVGPTTITGTARIRFYPATARTPAPRVAHGVFPVNQPLTLPRNIVRAYVDVIAQGTFGDRFWYTCVPSASMVEFPSLLTPWGIGDTEGGLGPPLVGCRGGSFRQVEVLVDGQPAGIAQVYPWLPSKIRRHRRVELDLPAPSVQALNFMPYRVDLTPFAGLLSDGTEHIIELRASAGGDTGFELSIEGNLLVYRDPATAQVTGAITRNTLTLPLVPTVSNTLALSGDIVQGVVDTRLDRRYAIEGYVDTAKGRVRSAVHTHVKFSNTQDIWAAGLRQGGRFLDTRGYSQHLRMESTVDRISRRLRGGVLLSEDREHIGYPLDLNHVATGVVSPDEIVVLLFDQLDVTVNQARIKRGDQYRQGVPRYQSQLLDRFTGSFELDGGIFLGNQRSARSYLFKDSSGSCYSARLTTVQFEPTSYHAGGACPDGMNRVRWYAHPDGSPDNLGWTLPFPL